MTDCTPNVGEAAEKLGPSDVSGHVNLRKLDSCLNYNLAILGIYPKVMKKCPQSHVVSAPSSIIYNKLETSPSAHDVGG